MSCAKQYAALPFVVLADRIEVCLITSRTTGRWIIPKGWPEPDVTPHELAAMEAFEEAGLKGQVESRAVGRYRYLKRLGDGSDIECDVSVYPMLVAYQAIDWPERTQRTAAWVRPKKAAKLVDDKGLSVILGRFPRTFESLATVSRQF